MPGSYGSRTTLDRKPQNGRCIRVLQSTFPGEMLAMIQTLLQRGHAYVDDCGQVYFNVATFAEYGHLSGKVMEDLEAGARICVRAEKRDEIAGFALWKVDSKHLMQWDPHSPQGWREGSMSACSHWCHRELIRR